MDGEYIQKLRHMIKTLITLLLLISTTNTIAEEIAPIPDLKEYDVEVIIFEDAHARYLNSQSWNQAIQHTDENTIDEDIDKDIGKNPANFEPIKPSILSNKYKRVSNSSEYNVLFYGAWRQPGLDKNKAFEIDINDLENKHVSKSSNKLTGKFKLVLARYLHIYNELEYQRELIAATENTEKKTEINDEIYPLKSHRRMRSKELHYIDHPLVGMLIQINPVEKQEEEKL